MSSATGGEGFSGVSEGLVLATASLSQCLRDWQLVLGIGVAGATLILYDWFLTGSDELAFLWRKDGNIYVRIPFFLARYSAIVSAFVSLLTPTVTRTNILTVLRGVAVLSSEFILVARTWAICERTRPVLIFLVILATVCITPGIAIAGFDIATTRTATAPFATQSGPGKCPMLTSDVGRLWVAPYVLIAIFEAAILALTLYKVLQLYRRTPQLSMSKLVDVLWIDGIVYFFFMLLLSVLNVGLVLQMSDPLLRRGGTQMQTVFHSLLSTRIVLHITTTVKQNRGDLGSPLAPPPARVDFTA